MPEKVLPQARRETSDIGFRPMLIALSLVLTGLLAIALFARWLYPEAARDHQHRVELPRFAHPMLQPNTAADMQAFRAAEMARLDGAGWLDRERGIVHLPITDAMRQLATRGIPDWPTIPQRPER